MKKAVIELLVINHPGVLYRITGIFARRGFNLDGVIASSINGGEKSRMYLLVDDDYELIKIGKELENNFDVLELSYTSDVESGAFYPETDSA